jgi:hypothetical protein
MDMSEGGARPPSQSTILSRDQHGEEHHLSVADHPTGMIFIGDDEIVRILSPSATAALVLHLIHAMGGYLSVRPVARGAVPHDLGLFVDLDPTG